MSYVTLVQPAKASGQKEMPFGRDALVVPSNIFLDRVPVPSREREIWGSETSIRSDAVYRQITLAFTIVIIIIIIIISDLPSAPM